MNTMDSMEMSIAKKVETFKDIIQNISEINNEMNANLQMITDALVNGSYPANNDKNPDDPITMMASIKRERDKAQENLKLLISIRECLW